MNWFRQTIEQHRTTFLTLLAINVFFMVDGTSYVYAHELKQKEREQFLLGFSSTFGVPLEQLQPERKSMQERFETVYEDHMVPWAASGSRLIDGVYEELVEQFEEATFLPEHGRVHVASTQELSGSGSAQSSGEEPRAELSTQAITAAGKEQAKAASLAKDGGFPLRRSEQKARTVQGTASALKATGTPARAPASVPRGVIPKSDVASEIVALAESLGNSPGRIFRYVHDQIGFDPKWGAGKTALGTLHEGSGTSWEQAWLLQELLIAAGVDARFEWGEVQIPTELLLGIAGVVDPFRAGDLLTTAGMPIVLVVEGSQVVHARMSHAWVKAHLDYIPNRGATPGPGDTWIRMDPSLKRFDVTEGVRLDEAVPYVLGDYLEGGTEESPRQVYETALQAHIDDQNLGVTLEQIQPVHSIVEEAFPFVPGTLRGKILNVAGESATLPESHQQQLALEVREAGGAVLLSWTLPWPSAYGRRLELAWPGATSADQATLDLYGGVFQTPPYEVDLKPVLRLDGVDLVTGSAIGSAEDAVLRATLTPPAGSPTVVPFELRAGERAVFAVDFGRTPQQTIDNHAAALAASSEADELEAWGLALAAATYTRSLAGDIEQLSLLRGLRRVQLGNTVLAVQRGGVSTAPDGTPLTFAIAPPAVDLGSMTLGLFPADSVPASSEASVSTLELLGSHGSFLEGEALAAALGGTHLTAVTALTRAVRQGQSLTRVDVNNVDAALAASDLGDDAEDSIRAGVDGGQIAWIHQNQLLHETWDAAGYVLEDPATGAGGYFVTYERLLTGLDADITFHSPQDLAVITEPTDVVATIDSEHEITSWTLSYKAADGGEAVVLASGSGTVTHETLAEFDPTLLLNGLYDLVLTARDALGQAASAKSSVVVEGQMKIGHFMLSYVDLAVPVSGLDIEIVRTYDSRDKQLRDFGIGWNLDIRQGSYVNNRAPGDGWIFETGFVACDTTIESKSHLTVVRLSDQEIYRFALRLYGGAPSIGGGCRASARFDFIDGPLPGTTLEILGNDQVFWENGSDRVIDIDTLNLFEPDDVRLTTRDGRIFDFDLANGVTHVKDLNGNQIQITPAGINHSSGVGIAFDRDSEGRITRITDPRGAEILYSYSASGDLDSVTDRAVNTTRFGYSSQIAHLLEDIEDPRGVEPIRNDYDESGRLIRHTDAFGKTIDLLHDLDNRREVVTNRLGHSRVLEYDGRGNIVRETDELGAVTERSFDDKDRLLSERDALGRTTTFTYSAGGDLLALTNPLGLTTTLTYNARGQHLTLTDPRGHVTTSTYDASGNQLTSTNALGETTAFTYDGSGNLLTVTDPQGQTTTSAYDSRGHLLTRTDAVGNVTAFTHDANGNRLTESRERTLPDGSTETLVTTFTYDGLDRATQLTTPDGSTISTTYDVLGKVLSRTDPGGRVTDMTYDLMGRLAGTAFPDGTTESQTYDAEGRVVSEFDRLNRVTRYTYDATGRLLNTTFPDGATETMAYNTAGELVSTTDARGNTSTYAYDLRGSRTRVTDALGQVTTFAYDANGNQTSVTDARGKITSFTYDELDRLVTTTFPDGTTTEVAYDSLGQRVSETDQAGLTTQFGHDALGRMTSVTDALGQVTAYAYDEVGRLIAQTDANGHTTRFEHDRLGRRVARVFPDGAREALAYNVDGSLASHTDFAGRTRTFEYDLEQRLTRRAYPDGSEDVFTYTATGRRATAADGRGVTSYTYDERDRLVAKQEPTGHQLTYAYDPQGNLTTLTATVGVSSHATSYSYDALNRLQTIVDPQGQVSTHSYDANGNRVSLGHANGLTTSYSYDDLNRLTLLETQNSGAGVVQSYSYTLSPSGRRTRIDETGGTVRAYTYDDLYRLTQDRVTNAGGGLYYQRDYVYDPVGNRMAETTDDGSGPSVVSSNYDNRDRLTTAGATGYSWDANGNLTARGGATFSWDFDQRLTTATLADGTVIETLYDTDGNRVQSRATPASGPTVTVDYLVDTRGGLSHVVAEVVAGTAQTVYVRSNDELISLYRPASDQARYFHADGLGSIRYLTDTDGTTTDQYDYTAFGVLVGHSGADQQPYRFAGEPYDPNSKFYFNRARWLDPAGGRFVSVDPFGGFSSDPLSLHKYLYASADPLNRLDPTGEASFLSIGMSLVAAGLVNVAFSIALGNNLPPDPDFKKNLLSDFLWGAALAPVGGLFSRIGLWLLKPIAPWILRGIGSMTAITLRGRGPITKLLIRFSRLFLNTNKSYPTIGGTVIGRLLKRWLPSFQWQNHHAVILASYTRHGSTNQIYTNVLQNRGLRRLGNALWNLAPIPGKLNNFIGDRAIWVQLFATIWYSSLFFGPWQTIRAIQDER